MRIDQDRIDKLADKLDRKYLPYLIKEIEVSGYENIDKIKESPTLILSNHLSHMDYIAIPFVLNVEGISHPAIVAGNNLDRRLTRKLMCEDTGAVFVDRKASERGSLVQRKEVLEKVQRDIGAVVSSGHNMMLFPEGGRSYDGSVMENFKDRYVRAYIDELSAQNVSPERMQAVNVAINYSPKTIEKPFLPVASFFKNKSFHLYFASDILAYLTQPIRKKPNVYMNFGEPYCLDEFKGRSGSKELAKFVKADIQRLFKEIS